MKTFFVVFYNMYCLFVKAGHQVTVYEKNDRCGGLLMYGIPSMKIEKEVCMLHAFICNVFLFYVQNYILLDIRGPRWRSG
jgi:hypothetical protein